MPNIIVRKKPYETTSNPWFLVRTEPHENQLCSCENQTFGPGFLGGSVPVVKWICTHVVTVVLGA